MNNYINKYIYNKHCSLLGHHFQILSDFGPYVIIFINADDLITIAMVLLKEAFNPLRQSGNYTNHRL
jgi:hypothetical protein